MQTTTGVHFFSSHQLSDVVLTENISVKLCEKLNAVNIQTLVHVYYCANVQQLSATVVADVKLNKVKRV